FQKRLSKPAAFLCGCQCVWFIWVPSLRNSRDGSRTLSIVHQSWTKLYDRGNTSERAPGMGGVATRNFATSELFSRGPGDGNNVPFLGPDHLVGYSRGRDRTFLGIACRMDLRNAP